MIPVNQILDIIKKQGAVGILALWLWYTHNEVQDLKVRLYDCMKQPQISQGKSQSSNSNLKYQDLFAILPDKRKLI